MTIKQAIIATIIIAIVTATIRFTPFLIFTGKKTPKLVEQLGSYLPYSIMGVLVVYCLKGIHFTAIKGFLPELIASTIVVISYIWKRNTLLSIIAGTLCYMLLVQVVFV